MSEKNPIVGLCQKASFLISAAQVDQCPPDEGLEVAFAGRSNAGKSSALNTLTHANLARTSKTPGRTQLLNFFALDDSRRLVDLPGYGYAKVPIDLQVLFGFPGSRQGGQGGAAEQGASGQEGGDGARICGTHGGPLVVIVVMGRAECAKRTDKRPLKIRHTPIAWGYEWKRMSDTWSDNRRKWPYEQL